MSKEKKVAGNIFVRENLLKEAGDFVERHKHNFDHMTLIATGSALVKATLPDGTTIEQRFDRGEFFLVKKDVEHRIEALLNNTLFLCVYSHRDAQGEVVEEYTGWGPAYG